MADKTIAEVDVDKDGKVSFEEFCSALADVDIDKRMGIRFLD